MSVSSAERVRQYVGVYDADGTWRGEVAYVWGKVRGTAHCGLCDITHSPVRRKRAWDAFVAGLGVPFDLVHRDEREPSVTALTGGAIPAVVAELAAADGSVRWARLLGPQDLAALRGDVPSFARALAAATAAACLPMGRDPHPAPSAGESAIPPLP